MRRVFLRQVIYVGWRWLLGVTDHMSRVLTVAAAVGVPGLALLSLGWWGLVGGAVVVVLLAFVEGAFQTWREAATELASRRSEQEARARVRKTCLEWVASVETFLDARAVKAPGPRGDLAALLAGPPETAEQRETRTSYDRDTVSIYVQTHRGRGVELFDLLVRLGTIAPDRREYVRSPPTALDAHNAAGLLRSAASRL